MGGSGSRSECMRCFFGVEADGSVGVLSALEPVPPFAKYEARLRMSAVVVPLLVASLTLRAEAALRGMSFFIGIIFFSQPVLSRAFERLTRRAPHWRERLALRRYARSSRGMLYTLTPRAGRSSEAYLPTHSSPLLCFASQNKLTHRSRLRPSRVPSSTPYRW